MYKKSWKFIKIVTNIENLQKKLKIYKENLQKKIRTIISKKKKTNILSKKKIRNQ